MKYLSAKGFDLAMKQQPKSCPLKPEIKPPNTGKK